MVETGAFLFAKIQKVIGLYLKLKKRFLVFHGYCIMKVTISYIIGGFLNELGRFCQRMARLCRFRF